MSAHLIVLEPWCLIAFIVQNFSKGCWSILSYYPQPFGAVVLILCKESDATVLDN